MRTVFTVATVVLVAALAVVHASQSTGSISGVINDTTGRALPGATITVASDDGRVRATVTDSTGRYAVGGLTPGRHRIQASMSGFETKVSALSLLPARDGDWSGALLIAGAAIGEGSIERKVLRETGWDAVDCGRHDAGASQAALQRSLTCALTSARVQRPVSVIVQSVADGTRGGHGLLAGSDGILHIFQYQKGGLRFQLQRCQFPDVTRRASGPGFEFTCQP